MNSNELIEKIKHTSKDMTDTIIDAPQEAGDTRVMVSREVLEDSLGLLLAVIGDLKAENAAALSVFRHSSLAANLFIRGILELVGEGVSDSHEEVLHLPTLLAKVKMRIEGLPTSLSDPLDWN